MHILQPRVPPTSMATKHPNGTATKLALEAEADPDPLLRRHVAAIDLAARGAIIVPGTVE